MPTHFPEDQTPVPKGEQKLQHNPSAVVSFYIPSEAVTFRRVRYPRVVHRDVSQGLTYGSRCTKDLDDRPKVLYVTR